MVVSVVQPGCISTCCTTIVLGKGGVYGCVSGPTWLHQHLLYNHRVREGGSILLYQWSNLAASTPVVQPQCQGRGEYMVVSVVQPGCIGTCCTTIVLGKGGVYGCISGPTWLHQHLLYNQCQGRGEYMVVSVVQPGCICTFCTTIVLGKGGAYGCVSGPTWLHQHLLYNHSVREGGSIWLCQWSNLAASTPAVQHREAPILTLRSHSVMELGGGGGMN